MEKEKFMTKERFSLYLFFLIYFIFTGFSSYMGKYFGEIGLSDSQIGAINAIPAVLCFIVQPLWGVFTDRTKYKKNTILLCCIVTAVLEFFVDGFRTFIPVLIGLSAVNIMMMPVVPTATSISLEYTRKHGGTFGSIRMFGTMGYQLGALVLGFILTESLQGMLKLISLILFISAFIAILFPNVEGHQHGKEKVSFFSVLKDKRMILLLVLVFFSQITQQFNHAFFTKLQGDMGISNTATGIITFASVLLEVPFLFFSGWLYKKLSMWKWLLVGLLVNGVRWLFVAHASTAIGFILCGLPGITLMACSEFFPALYIDDISSDKVKASAQSVLALVTSGFARLAGGLLGGQLAGKIGISNVYITWGIMLLSCFVIFLIPCLKMEKYDKQTN